MKIDGEVIQLENYGVKVLLYVVDLIFFFFKRPCIERALEGLGTLFVRRLECKSI